MLPAAIDSELSRDPFVPIRLHLSNGRTYAIHNPGLCWINRGSIYIALDNGLADRPHSRNMSDVDLVSLRHVVRIKALEPGGDTNGIY